MILVDRRPYHFWKKNKEMLLKRRKSYVILASGRPTPADDSLCQRIKTDNLYMISYNGAVIIKRGQNNLELTQDQIHERLYEYS
jgi:hydroxymethylpyrimidine pyrophosphatase-like HAD family hydrolase